MNVTIVMPIHNPDRALLARIRKQVKAQKFPGKIELIEVEKGWGLAKTMNYGLRKAKYPIAVTLHQDCIPISDSWLSGLVKPLKNPHIVACCSDVIDFESGKRYTPLLDEKGCVYKKSALERVGFFDEKTFLNSGEDMDMYMKLSKIGRIAHPHSIVEHHHPGYLTARGYKRLQNANTWGCLFRVYGFSLPGWWKPLIKANVFNPHYLYWFWRGFFKRKQDFKR